MKKTILIFGIAVVATVAFSCSNSATNTTTQGSETQKKVVYTCPMHPEVLSDTAGTCSKCGMALVVKE